MKILMKEVDIRIVFALLVFILYLTAIGFVISI